MFDVSLSNTLEYYPEKCVNCGLCIDVCPHEVFEPGENAVVLSRPEACMECGACQVNCPTDALEVESGVGCAWAIMWSAVKGEDEPSCGCGPAACC